MSKKVDDSTIRQFWILNRGGLCLFHRSNVPVNKSISFESKDDLMSGMFSALRSFTNELTNSEIKKFESTESKYLFFADQNLLFIVEAKLDVADKKIRQKVQLIKDLFLKKYANILENFSGEMAKFASFEEVLDKIFQKMSLSEEWGSELSNLKF
jgi:hypothetical protein